MKKYLTNSHLILIRIITLTGIFIILNNLIFNAFLIYSKEDLFKSLSRSALSGITTGSMYYIFPNMIVLENLQLTSLNPSPGGPLIHLPKVVTKFSIWALLSKQEILLSKFIFYSPYLDYERTHSWLKEHISAIIALFRTFPHHDVQLSMKEAIVKFQSKNKKPDYLNSTVEFRLKGDSVSSKGSVGMRKNTEPLRAPGHGSDDQTFEYQLDGRMKNDGFLLKKLEVTRDDLYLNLWGESIKGVSQINGYSFIGESLNLNKNNAYIKRMSKTPDMKIGNTGRPINPNGAPMVDFYLLDINSRFRIISNQIFLDNLGMTLNDIPFYVNGKVTFDKSTDFNFAAAVNPSIPLREKMNLRSADLKVSGNLKDQELYSNGNLNIYLSKNKNNGLPIEKIEIGFKDLSSNISDYPQVRTLSKKSEINFLINDKTYPLHVDNFNTSINLEQDKQKNIDFDSPFYGGTLKGQASVENKNENPHVQMMLALRDVEISELDNVPVERSKISGRLNADVNFHNNPDPQLKGNLELQNGHLKDMEFLRWFAGFLGLPQLEEIQFSEISSNFLMNTHRVYFNEVRLQSDNIAFKGNLNIKDNTMLLSWLSLTLDRDLIWSSPRFRPLLESIDKDIDPLTFDFKLSGTTNSINFHWMTSHLKEQIQRKIPNFMERQIEQRIENSVQDSAKN